MKLMNKKSLNTIFFLLATITFCHAQSAFDKMTNDKMQKILLRETEKVEGTKGNWQVMYRELPLLIITDENYNRMRIISPIIKIDELDQSNFKLLLESNFAKALDAKSAIFDEIVWSVFTHPLGELTVEQFKDAMKQVVMLSKTFGTTYTSTDFVFGTANEEGGGG